MLKGTPDFFNLIYPKGSVYTTFDTSFNPNISFGGTWERINSTFLYATSQNNQVGSTGGSADAIVVSHTHDIKQLNVWGEQGDVFGQYATPDGSWKAYTYRTDQTCTPSNAGKFIATTTGVSGTDKNMPPYTKVIMWKRTA